MSFDDVVFNHYVTWGDNRLGSCTYDRHPVILENRRLGIKRMVVDEDGSICDFPGVAHPEVVSCYTRRHELECVSFRSTIEDLGDMWALIWRLEPDWRNRDDSYRFGAASQVEVRLYARLDERGRFIEPFRLYDVGETTVYGTRAEDELVASMDDMREPHAYLEDEVANMVSQLHWMLLGPSKDARVTRLMPGTCLEATLCTHRRGYSWLVGACVPMRFKRPWPREFARRCSPTELAWYLGTDEARLAALLALERSLEERG